MFQRRYRSAIQIPAVLTAIIFSLTLGSLNLQARSLDGNAGVTATVGANVISLQAGPGLNYSSVGTATLGQVFPVIGRAHGSNRIWYKVVLPSGDTAWVSERVVNISPSPDSLPWLGDNVAKTPLIMDCGQIPPSLFVGEFVQVTWAQGVILSRDPGLGKIVVGSVPQKGYVKVLDGPFCTLLNMNSGRYQIQWLVQTEAGLSGYMLEGIPNSTQNYVQPTSDVDSSNFPASAATSAPSGTPSATSANTDRPSFVSDANIQAVSAIFQAVQANKLNQDQATAQLTDLVNANHPGMLPWIVRRVPIYDGKLQQWISFARYDDMSLMTFNIDSALDTDPVNTTIIILFGQYTDATQEFQDVGCGG